MQTKKLSPRWQHNKEYVELRDRIDSMIASGMNSKHIALTLKCGVHQVAAARAWHTMRSTGRMPERPSMIAVYSEAEREAVKKFLDRLRGHVSLEDMSATFDAAVAAITSGGMQ